MNSLQILTCIYPLKKGIRVGISYISDRYGKVKNKFLKHYDQKQDSKHIIYLDANNLYGCAMSKFLPTKGFKWIDPKEFYLSKYHCVKSVRIQSYSDPHFSALVLNMETYSVSLCIQTDWGKYLPE